MTMRLSFKTVHPTARYLFLKHRPYLHPRLTYFSICRQCFLISSKSPRPKLYLIVNALGVITFQPKTAQNILYLISQWSNYRNFQQSHNQAHLSWIPSRYPMTAQKCANASSSSRESCMPSCRPCTTVGPSNACWVSTMSDWRGEKWSCYFKDNKTIKRRFESCSHANRRTWGLF